MWAYLGAMLAHLGAMLAHLRGYVGPVWGYVGPSWGYVGPSWALCWLMLGLCWPILRPILAHLDPSCATRAEKVPKTGRAQNTVNLLPAAAGSKKQLRKNHFPAGKHHASEGRASSKTTPKNCLTCRLKPFCCLRLLQ